MGKNIIKIVITGGPCAGKTTAMKHVKNHFSNAGYDVLLMSETATELINSGISPKTLDSKENYQKIQLAMQKAKEEIFFVAAGMINNSENVIIFCDRGLMDSKAYTGKQVFDSSIQAMNTSEKDILAGYDAVFYLTSTANGVESCYTIENNSARTETVEEAYLLDKKIAEVWGEHQYFITIPCCSSIEEKIDNLIKEIEIFLDKKCHM